MNGLLLGVVNGDAALLKMFQDSFEYESYRVTSCLFGPSTLAELRAAQPTMIVVDVGISGAGARLPSLRQLRLDDYLRQIPAVITSVDPSFLAAHTRELYASAVAVLTIPDNLNELSWTVQALTPGQGDAPACT